MATQTPRNRGGNGKFTRAAESRRRDCRAAELHGQGWSYQRIADELGFASKGHAHNAVMRAYADIVTEEAAHARRVDLDRLDRLIEQAWQVMLTPHLTVNNGKVIRHFVGVERDEDGIERLDMDGKPIPVFEDVLDDAPRLAAVREIRGLLERRARIFGYDAPAKSRVEVITSDMVESQIAELNRNWRVMTPQIQAPPDRLRYLLELQHRAAKIKHGIARYYDDPVGFARDCIDWGDGEGLTEYQEEVLDGIPRRKRVAVRGPHGLGKSGIAAIAVLWFALTRDAAGVDWKVPATAGSWHQLTQYLFPEIHKWACRLRWDKVRDGRPFSRAHELQNLNLRLAHGSAFAGASANAALIEGAHADSLLFLFDEGKAIPAATFDACEGALGGTGEAFALVLSTPGAPSGRFYDICVRRAGYEDWHPVHVTLERAMAAGRISGEWAAQRARQWGEQSAIYQNRVLGEFFASDEDSVIPLAWAEAAVARWHAWNEAGRPDPGRPRVVGVDVAYTGQDRTVLAVRKGPVITELRRSVKEDTMQTTGRVKAILDGDDSYTAVVDAIGIGAGVVDRLREQGAKVLAFNASKASKAKDSTREFGFSGRRSEAWWTMRQALDPSGNPDICLPDDEMLLGDLSAPQWTVTSSGRIQVEGKDEIRKRLGRSTDDGDAVVQSFVPHLGDASPGSVRQWAGHQEFENLGVNEETKAQRRMREIQGRAAEGLEDAPWDLDGFGPQDEREARPNRGNVRSWR